MNVFVVTCHYDGCDEWCSSGSHVVGVFFNEEDATKAEREHEKNNDHHHGCYCETTKEEVK